MEDKLIVGEILKAHGIKGELKVRPITKDISRFYKLRAVYIDSALYQINGVRISKDFAYIKLANVTTRNDAEKLVGKFIQIDRIYAISTKPDEFFIVDLIGCDFIADDLILGKISDIYQYGAADVIEIMLNDGKIMLIPFLKELNLKIDIVAKKVSIDKKDLDRVAVIN